MSLDEIVVVAHLVATAFMVGLIWTIHAVHYPLFALVGEPYRPYQDAHMQRITALLVVPWGVEVVSAGWLLLAVDAVDLTWRLAGAALLGAILVVTAFGAAPRHGELLERFDADIHRRLMRIDALRTALWTLRGVVAVAMLVEIL